MSWRAPSHLERIKILSKKYNLTNEQVNDIITFMFKFVSSVIKIGFSKIDGKFYSVKLDSLGTFLVSERKFKRYLALHEDDIKWIHDDREFLDS